MKKRKITITLEMEKKINDYLKNFSKKVIMSHLVRYSNGFTGVGILKKPNSHIFQKENTVWVFGCGFTDKGEAIEPNINVYMTEDESNDLLECLKVMVSEHSKYYEKLSLEQFRKNLPRRRIK